MSSIGDVAGRAWLAGLTTILVAGGAACGPDASASDGARQERAAGSGDAGRTINVEVVRLDTEEFVESLRLTGTAEANQDVEVSAEESGTIRQFFVEQGDAVERGQAIAKIDDGILRAQVKQARARADLARETFERRRQLYEEDRAISQIDYLEARSNASEAEGRLEELEERLARTTIRSPISGILETRRVEAGSNVSPGTDIVRVVDLDPVKVTGGVPERYASDIAVGTAVSVRFDVLPDESFDGELIYVGATVNPRNRTFPVEFRLPNPDRAVKPEMVANISLVRSVLEDAVTVPQDALVREEEGYRAFVVAEESGGSVARARQVELGPAQGNRVVIRSGLSAGDRLVVAGQQRVAGGDRVRIVENAGRAAGRGAAEPDADTAGRGAAASGSESR